MDGSWRKKMETISAVICLLIAIFIESWRSYCAYWEKNLRSNCPVGWRSFSFRLGSLIIVLLSLLWFSFVGAGIVTIQTNTKDWWTFAFLALLLAPWLISKGLGYSKAKKEHLAFIGQVEKEHGPISSWKSPPFRR
jgi:hypothetical protein